MSKSLFTASFYPAPLYVKALRDKFQDAWVDWEPETLWQAIRTEFGAEEISDGAKAAIQAVKTYLANPAAYTSDIRGFELITVGLNNFPPSFDSFEVATPEEIHYGYQLLSMLGTPPVLEDRVITYVQACFSQAGVIAYPKVLIFAEPPTVTDLRNQVRERAAGVRIDPDHLNIDDIVEVQAAKLQAITEYAEYRITLSKEMK